MEIMIQFGFFGRIHPVDPNTDEMLGIRAYPSIRDANEPIDPAVISTPPEATMIILEDCLAAKVESATIINQGFTDADDRGKEQLKAIVALVKRDDSWFKEQNNKWNYFSAVIISIPCIDVRCRALNPIFSNISSCFSAARCLIPKVVSVN